MAKPTYVKVNPEVFKWLREGSGWTVEEVAKKLGTSVRVVREIEEGKRDTTFRQLRVLSSAFKVPVAAFLLPKPRKEVWPKDYRMIPGKEGIFDKKTIIAIRRAKGLQEAARELLENIGESPEPKIIPAQIKKSPVILAKKYREILGLSVEKQIEFDNAHTMFNYLREQLENLNIFTFQFSMPIEDARGFALTDEYPAVIVVNSKDIIEARIFTLLHELAHVLLGESVIDKPSILFPAPINVEKWCNEFASSFLLPKEQAIQEFSRHRSSLTDTKTLGRLSSKYKVSKQMLLYNMSKYGFISKKVYEEIKNTYRQKELKQDVEGEEEEEKGWGPPPDKRKMVELGHKLILTVIKNYHKEAISYSEALDILSTKSKTFEKLVVQVSR